MKATGYQRRILHQTVTVEFGPAESDLRRSARVHDFDSITICSQATRREFLCHEPGTSLPREIVSRQRSNFSKFNPVAKSATQFGVPNDASGCILRVRKNVPVHMTGGRLR